MLSAGVMRDACYDSLPCQICGAVTYRVAQAQSTTAYPVSLNSSLLSLVWRHSGFREDAPSPVRLLCVWSAFSTQQTYTYTHRHIMRRCTHTMGRAVGRDLQRPSPHLSPPIHRPDLQGPHRRTHQTKDKLAPAFLLYVSPSCVVVSLALCVHSPSGCALG